MVGPSERRDSDSHRDQSLLRDERGQLLLVGAIAIALVLMGLVVVFNTVLYTETTAPTETLESADEAEAFNQQVRNDSRQIMWWVANNSSSGGVLSGNYATYLRQNMSNYSSLMSISHADTGPVYVNISVNSIESGASATAGSAACPDVDLASTPRLCMNFTVVYSTQKFTYEKTNSISITSPVTI